MGSVDVRLAQELRDLLGLRRAVETGTYRGVTARALAGVFGQVTTIEIAPAIAQRATERLADLPQVTVLQGHSVTRLAEQLDPSLPTLWFLDGHWSGGDTGGTEDECPVLEELRVIGAGNSSDCLLVDDARLFQSAPPPPHRAELWPELTDVFDLLRELHPEHVVTLLGDQVVAVPRAAKPVLDAYGRRLSAGPGGLVGQGLMLASVVRERLQR